MKKLVYIPFAANIVLLVYLALYITDPPIGFIDDFLDYGWANLNMQYIIPAQWIALFASLIVPFVRVRILLRIATPLLAIGHLVLQALYWDIFKFP